MSALTKPRVEFDATVQEDIAAVDPPSDYSGWFCVRTLPFPCPAAGCDFVATHLTVAHLILVFPRKDDRRLLTAARDALKFGRGPKVEEYAQDFGPCIAYDAWVRIGRPVHGKVDRPEGWGEEWNRL